MLFTCDTDSLNYCLLPSIWLPLVVNKCFLILGGSSLIGNINGFIAEISKWIKYALNIRELLLLVLSALCIRSWNSGNRTCTWEPVCAWMFSIMYFKQMIGNSCNCWCSNSKTKSVTITFEWEFANWNSRECFFIQIWYNWITIETTLRLFKAKVLPFRTLKI